MNLRLICLLVTPLFAIQLTAQQCPNPVVFPSGTLCPITPVDSGKFARNQQPVIDKIGKDLVVLTNGVILDHFTGTLSSPKPGFIFRRHRFASTLYVVLTVLTDNGNDLNRSVNPASPELGIPQTRVFITPGNSATLNLTCGGVLKIWTVAIVTNTVLAGPHKGEKVDDVVLLSVGNNNPAVCDYQIQIDSVQAPPFVPF